MQTAVDVPSWCARCATRLKSDEGPRGNEPAAALAATALAFFPLALLAPFLTIAKLGVASTTSLLGGVASLFAEGHAFIGAIVLLFSVVLPVVKLATLLALATSGAWLRSEHRAVTYRTVEALGRWGMLDVLLVAVLIALVKLGDLVEFVPGPGLYLFALFAALNLAAGVAFDHHLLWEESMSENTPSPETTAAPQETPIAGDPRQWPAARANPGGRRVWWLLPALGIVAACGVAVALWPVEGERVRISFADGRGLKAGDAVRYRGINVGEVRSLSLREDGQGVSVELGLEELSKGLAVEGTRWWIVRPELGLSGAAGLETVIGGKYVTLLPGSGPPSRAFVGLEEPPLEDHAEAGGLSVIVQANAGPRLSRGAGVYHRGVRVGGVADVSLASDASAIEYRVYIRPRFGRLLTGQTRFWNTGGASVGVGLDGLRLKIESLSELLSGGMAIAVPEAGDPVPEDTRYVLHAEPEEAWLSWRPSLAADAAASAPPLPRPAVVEIVMTFQEAGFLASWSGPTIVRRLAVQDARRVVGAFGGVIPPDAMEVGVRVGGTAVEAEGIRDLGGGLAAVDTGEGPPARFARLSVPVDGRVLTGRDESVFLAAAQWVRDGDSYRLPEDRRVPDGSPLINDASGEVIAFIVGGEFKPSVPRRERGRLENGSDASEG